MILHTDGPVWGSSFSVGKSQFPKPYLPCHSVIVSGMGNSEGDAEGQHALQELLGMEEGEKSLEEVSP